MNAAASGTLGDSKLSLQMGCGSGSSGICDSASEKQSDSKMRLHLHGANNHTSFSCEEVVKSLATQVRLAPSMRGLAKGTSAQSEL